MTDVKGTQADLSVDGLLTSHIDHLEQRGRGALTIEGYRGIARGVAADRLGRRQLSEVGPKDFDDFYDRLRSRGLSPSTVQLGRPSRVDELRGDADELARSARRKVIERDADRAAQKQRYVDACRDLPGAQAAHAPLRAQVVDAEQVVTEARSNLWNAERDLRNAGKLQRRSARRNVEVANDVLAVAAERLARCEQAAEPTRRPLSELRDIVDHHDRIHSTREPLDDFKTSTEGRPCRSPLRCPRRVGALGERSQALCCGTPQHGRRARRGPNAERNQPTRRGNNSLGPRRRHPPPKADATRPHDRPRDRAVDVHDAWQGGTVRRTRCRARRRGTQLRSGAAAASPISSIALVLVVCAGRPRAGDELLARRVGATVPEHDNSGPDRAHAAPSQICHPAGSIASKARATMAALSSSVLETMSGCRSIHAWTPSASNAS